MRLVLTKTHGWYIVGYIHGKVEIYRWTRTPQRRGEGSDASEGGIVGRTPSGQYPTHPRDTSLCLD